LYHALQASCSALSRVSKKFNCTRVFRAHSIEKLALMLARFERLELDNLFYNKILGGTFKILEKSFLGCSRRSQKLHFPETPVEPTSEKRSGLQARLLEGSM